MRRLTALALVLSALVLALLPAAASAKTVKLTDKANGKTVTLRNGDNLKVVLDGASGSSGYFWEVTKRSKQSILKSGRHRSKAYKTCKEPCVGGGFIDTYTWKAVGTGETATRLALVGPGRDRAVGQRFRLRIVVR